jgi:hypothetical protein
MLKLWIAVILKLRSNLLRNIADNFTVLLHVANCPSLTAIPQTYKQIFWFFQNMLQYIFITWIKQSVKYTYYVMWDVFAFCAQAVFQKTLPFDLQMSQFSLFIAVNITEYFRYFFFGMLMFILWTPCVFRYVSFVFVQFLWHTSSPSASRPKYLVILPTKWFNRQM